MQETSEAVVTESAQNVVPQRIGRDWMGSLVGLSVFVAGVLILFFVFKLAYDQFTVPPKIALELQKAGQPINVNKAADTLVVVILKFFLLLLMAGMGSLIANRGIHLYAQSRGLTK